MTESKGVFIVFEGLDGAGTTTQARALVDWLSRHGRRATYTCEPSDGPIGALIRNALRGRVVSNPGDGSSAILDPRIIALLFAADRLDHVADQIKPALDQGFVVVSDRYVDSSLAYQSLNLPFDWVADLNRYARRPDLVIFLDVPAQTAMARLGSRSRLDHFEEVGKLTTVRELYLRHYDGMNHEGVVTIDGSQPPEVVFAEILRIWSEFSSLSQTSS